jgi:hypothetical protein
MAQIRQLKHLGSVRSAGSCVVRGYLAGVHREREGCYVTARAPSQLLFHTSRVRHDSCA